MTKDNRRLAPGRWAVFRVLVGFPLHLHVLSSSQRSSVCCGPRSSSPHAALSRRGNEQKVSYAPGWGSLLPHSKLSVDSGLQCPMCTDQRKYMLNASALAPWQCAPTALGAVPPSPCCERCLTKACCAMAAAKTSQLVSSKIVSSTY